MLPCIRLRYPFTRLQIGDMDTSRVSSRFNRDVEMINVLAMLHLMLPGTAFTYYGEEIGMHDLDDDQVSSVLTSLLE